MLTLFYAAGSSSMASHILLNEAELPFKLEKVDLISRKYSNGDYQEINRKDYVPALQLDNGEILTEGVAILSYISDQVPGKKLLSPQFSFSRYRELEMLNYIAMELHKNFITPERHGNTASNFLSKTAQGQHDTFKRVAHRLEYIDEILRKQDYLFGSNFTAADAYLYVMLTWTQRLGFSMDKWDGLINFEHRISKRNSVKKTIETEGPAHSLRVCE